MELHEPFVPTSFTGIGKVREFLTNPDRESELFDAISSGVPLTEAAAAIGVRYSDLYRVVTSEYREQYLAAREAHANILAELNLDLADKVVSREVPTDVAGTAVKIRQWHMERSAPEAYGQKSTVNMNVKQVAELHLSAIRKLANTPIEGECVEVEDDGTAVVDRVCRDDNRGGSVDSVHDPLKGDYDETEGGTGAVTDDLANHPLL